ncbi:MAG: ATP-binding protein [Leptolyngbyaceae cyanobacterium]
MRECYKAASVHRLRIPTINDGPHDFKRLFQKWQSVQEHLPSLVRLDFSGCRFLRPNAIAFLGGMARSLELMGVCVDIDFVTIQENVRRTLDRNDFLASFGAEPYPWDGNSVPYCQYSYEEFDSIPDYLEDKWLGRGWVKISDSYKEEIISNTLEIYQNAFEHSNSPIGVVTCGQQFPNMKLLKLTVIDFGIGVPTNVRNFRNHPNMLSTDAFRWAFQKGHSTRKGFSGGDGLSILKSFVMDKQGKIEIYSHDGYAIFSEDGEDYRVIDSFFEGTLVNITVKCDIEVCTEF